MNIKQLCVTVKAGYELWLSRAYPTYSSRCVKLVFFWYKTLPAKLKPYTHEHFINNTILICRISLCLRNPCLSSRCVDFPRRSKYIWHIISVSCTLMLSPVPPHYTCVLLFNADLVIEEAAEVYRTHWPCFHLNPEWSDHQSTELNTAVNNLPKFIVRTHTKSENTPLLMDIVDALSSYM